MEETKQIPNRVVVDTTTGEIITELKEGDSIRRKTTDIYLEDTIEINKDRGFTKLFSSIKYVVNDISSGALSIAVQLQTYIMYTSNLVAYDINNPITNSDIEKITGYSKRTVIACMDELVTNKVFARTKVGKSYLYYANPYIFCKGKRVNKTLISMFKNYKYKDK